MKLCGCHKYRLICNPFISCVLVLCSRFLVLMCLPSAMIACPCSDKCHLCLIILLCVYWSPCVFPMCLESIYDWTKMSWLFRGTLLVFWTLVWGWQESRQGKKARAEGMEAFNEKEMSCHLDIPFPIGGIKGINQNRNKVGQKLQKWKWTKWPSNRKS